MSSNVKLLLKLNAGEHAQTPCSTHPPEPLTQGNIVHCPQMYQNFPARVCGLDRVC